MIRNRIIKSAQTLLMLLIPLTIGLSGSAAGINVFKACSNGAGKTDVCQSVNPHHTDANPVIGLISSVIAILAVVIGVAAVIMIVISGLRIILASGDSQAIASARSSIVTALVGLVVAALAESLVVFVLNKF